MYMESMAILVNNVQYYDLSGVKHTVDAGTLVSITSIAAITGNSTDTDSGQFATHNGVNFQIQDEDFKLSQAA